MKEKLFLLPGLVLALQGCGESPPPKPTWTELARGFRPTSLQETIAGWGDEGSRSVPDDEAQGIWVERDLPSWQADATPGLWSAERPRDGAFAIAQGPVRLRAGDETYVRALKDDPPEPGKYVLEDANILLYLGEGVAPPTDVSFGVLVRNGIALDGSWRVRVGDHIGAGIPLWPGAREELYTDIPPAAELQFLSLFSPTLPEPAADPRVEIVLELDGEPLWSHEQGAGVDHHRIALPAGGRKGARITLRATGAPGLAVAYDPVIGPLAHGSYGARPWGTGGRPNIVLFVADTFRADNLAAYGGSPELAPNLNRLAEESARFLEARSPAAWTLPALGTLFTGIPPGKHGATDIGLAVPRDLDTVTELLARRGYRTAAVTDSGFFTIAFGMDQGFAWFEENQNTAWDLDHTLAEALRFLERDDGRPIFLVVHTYRTHAPFRRGPEEDDSEWEALTAEAFAMLNERRGQGDKGDLKREVLLTFQARMRELYHAGVRDLDAGFGTLLVELREQGVLDDGFLFFTSDHGEALGENDDVLHGGRLWEVKLRIPLLVHGPGIPANDVAWSASLADIAPTILDLAGLRAPSLWTGQSLLDLEEERTHFAYRLEERNRELAVNHAGKKLLTVPDVERLRAGNVDSAFDLALDPGETQNLAGEPWVSELARRVWGKVADALEPATDATRVDTTPEAMKGLGDIGYSDE